MLDKTKPDWWKSAVFYQIYPKSFQDSNGDGVGDLRGIISRLDYLQLLGVDGLWLSPVYASPHADNGYDISDYRAIHPLFGTMEDMEELIAEAGQRGMTIIMDLVLNHTSDQHRWFLEAKSSRESPYHDYYVWRDGTPDAPPNGMRACFGGSAWTWVPELGQYYFNQFSPQQPDLNWENPEVRRELYEMIRFWVEKGIGGFRLDVIDQIAKEPDQGITVNGPRLHEYIRELRREAFREDTLVTVGEAWGADVERAKLFADPGGSELSMVFQFEHMCLDQGEEKWDVRPLPLVELKRCMERWQQGLYGQGWNSLFLDNHDLPRIVSRWGDEGKYRVESAKMLALMCHGMQGTPYIYQGEELGMTNIRLPIGEYDDLELKDCYRRRTAAGYAPEEVMASIWARGRDNARTPMQWSAEPYAGFSQEKPWLPVNPNYQEVNAEAALADAGSVFYFYQALIALRKQLPVFREGGFTLLEPEDEKRFAYLRETAEEGLLIVCNFTAETLPDICPEDYREGETLLANYPDPVGPLRPYEARLRYCNRKKLCYNGKKAKRRNGSMGRLRADLLLWIGTEAIYTWDRRTGSEGCIRFSGTQRQWIPYVPRFYDIWEDGGRYQDELREVLGLGRFRLFGKRRVLLAAPDDLTQIEHIALEDFIQVSIGGSLKRRQGVQVLSQSQLLPPGAGRYLTVTKSCRCYSVAVVEGGEAAEKVLLDINECSRETILRQIRDFHSFYHDSTIEVCYPQMEVDLLLDNLGAEMRMADIAGRWLG